MRYTYILFLCCGALSITAPALAQEPIINYNVHVTHNASPAQCSSMWKGQATDVSTQYYSGYGEEYNTTAAVQSCTGCSYDGNSRDCVCNVCYVNSD